MPRFIKHPLFYVPTLILAIVLAFIFLRKALWPEFTLPLDTIVVALASLYLMVLMPLTLIVMAVTGLVLKLRRKVEPANKWFKRTLPVLTAGAGAFGIVAVVGVMSEFATYTIPVVGTERVSSDKSIAEWKAVDINGVDQWLSIRGVDQSNPVILFVNGGPGISRVHSTQQYLRQLENNYTVVTWDQPGSGKTFVGTGVNPDLNVQTYVDDMNAVAEHLQQRFDKDKIYVVAESWGTIVASLAIAEQPEHYAAYFGTGQMVDMGDSQIEGYHLALETAKADGDQATVNALESAGEPHYLTDNFSTTYLNYLSALMAKDSDIDDPQIGFYNDVVIPEMSINDELGSVAGISDTTARITPLAYDQDLREKANNLEVPYYIFQGSHDINASNDLVEEYFELLEAPDKQLIWFERSGHTPWTSESDRFNSLVHEYIVKLESN